MILRHMVASAFATLLLSGAALAQTAPPASQTVAFKPGARTSGWVEFNLPTNLPILIPVRINGQDAAAMIYGGPSMIDKDFAASAGIKVAADASAPIDGLDIQIGELTLHAPILRAGAIPVAYYSKIAGHTMPLMLGREVFEQLGVDIDFPHRQMAFVDSNGVRRPVGAVEVPLVIKGDDKEDQWSVPLSVDGAPPIWVEVELGNVIGPLMLTRPYAEAHKLFDGHRTSLRLSGKYHEPVVSLDHVTFAGADFPQTPIAIIPDPEPPPAGVTGGLGLPLLSQFHLIFDYPHHRLFAVRNPDAAPIPKDRLGLVIGGVRTNPDQINFTVAFVAPGSPAEAAGFKAGDQMTRIDGKAYKEMTVVELTAFHMAAPGVVHTFTMQDGSTRTLTTRDFF